MTVTVSGTSGINLTSGNVPSFRAGISTAQALSAGASNILAYDTKMYDTASNFNNTNAIVNGAGPYSFKPSVPGYYQVNMSANTSNSPISNTLIAYLFRNSLEVCRGTRLITASAGNCGVVCSDTVYLNGSTDYIDARMYTSSACNVELGGTPGIVAAFSATLIRPDQVFPVAAPVTVNNGPLFSAFQAVSQNINHSTTTKVIFDTKEFDTGNYFNTATSRFQSLVSGYYKVDAVVSIGAVCLLEIWKNGVAFKRGTQYAANANGSQAGVVSGLIFLNGSTDYIEIFVAQYSGITQATAIGSPTPHLSYFSAAMVRQ